MASFKLREGEQIVFQFECELLDGGKWVPSRLIITNERVVTCAGTQSKMIGALLGKWVEKSFASMMATRVTHVIPRERFASVELEDRVLVFRDDGEGYAHTSFAIMSNVLATQAGLATLQEHLGKPS